MSRVQACTELVIVCCHAIYDINTEDPFEESNWHLKSFQRSDKSTRKPGEHLTFVTHIQAAAEALRRPETLVVFSGGATDEAVPYSEAASYEKVFTNLYPDDPSNSHRSAIRDGQRWLCEEASTDSFQNLLFSILAFRSRVGRYPDTMTVITHAFKTDRFLRLHAPALRWPRNRVRVQGINPPFTAAELEAVQSAELQYAIVPFETTPLGDRGVLLEKRKQRGWSARTAEDLAKGQDDSVAALLQWSGSYSHAELAQLPWE